MSKRKNRNEIEIQTGEESRPFNKEEAVKAFAKKHPNDPLPITRRQFVGQGTLAATSYVMMPTLLGSLVNTMNAQAAALVCPTPASNSLPKYLMIDGSGGFALTGNVVPTDAGGQLLTSYDKMGLGTASQLSVTSQFGVPFATAALGQGTATASATTSVSFVLRGMLATMSAATQAATRGGLTVIQSDSDSNGNALNPVQAIAYAGSKGSRVITPVGTSSSSSGGNSTAYRVYGALKPLQISSFNSLNNALTPQGAFSTLNGPSLVSLYSSILGLSQSQMAKINGMSGSDQLSTLSQCGMMSNRDNTAPPAGTDPRLDPDFQAVYGLTAGSSASSSDTIRATVVASGLSGLSGPGVIQIGGCDYHDNGQASTDAKDLEIGREIGRAAEAAFRKGQVLMIQVTTDGGISSGGARDYSSDNNQIGGGILTLVVNPPSAGKSIQQIAVQKGFFTSAQVATTSTKWGNANGNAGSTAAAMGLAQWIALASKVDPRVFNAALFAQVNATAGPAVNAALTFDESLFFV